jgi:glycosyltransferase involved in cell wall biosynthesis
VAKSKKKAKQQRQPAGVRQPAKTLSVCMIVKNEEQHIRKCLESIRPVADEIIIVDTGSTDRTLDIAGEYTDRIYSHPWEDHFSKARNQSLSYAKGDWIFVVDADEELVSQDAPSLRHIVEKAEADAIMIQVASRLRNGQSEAIHNSDRIFRNNGVIHYEGRVHNRLVGHATAEVHPIRLIHHGYDLEPERAKKKAERTTILLRKDLDEDPGNPMTYHYLGCAYLSQAMFMESLEASLTSIRIAEQKQDGRPLYLWTRYNAAMACYRLGDKDKAADLSLEALRKDPRHIDSHFILALVYYDKKLWPRVIQQGREYSRLLKEMKTSPASFGNLVTCTMNEEWNIHFLVAVACHEIGQHEAASEHLESAVSASPDPLVPLRAAGLYFYNHGEVHKARRYLRMAAEQGTKDPTVEHLLLHIDSMGSPRAPKLSCCMIVKNEECSLPRCLDSVKDHVDELIVVDTGSTDQTVEIARQYTDNVYFHSWEGSFSKARNQSLGYASGDWILIIDADEEIVQGHGPRIRQAAADAGSADAILMKVISPYNNGAKRAFHNSERMFRNNGVIRYEGIVHNALVGIAMPKPSDIEIMHYGYDVDEKKAHEKFIRTTDLLKKQIAENPRNPMPHHYLGASYLTRGMHEEAARESVTAIGLAREQGNGNHLFLWTHFNAAMALFRLGHLKEAEQYCLQALDRFSDHLDSSFMMTVIAAEKKDWPSVCRYGGQYLNLRDVYESDPQRAGMIINNTMKEEASVHLLVGHACHALGHHPDMERHYREAVEIADLKWETWWNIAAFHLDRSEDFALAEESLQRAAEMAPGESAVWYLQAKLNHVQGRSGEERRWLEKIFEAGKADLVVCNRLALIYLEAGDLERASLAAETALGIEPLNYAALCTLGRLYRRLGQLDPAVDTFIRAAGAHPEGADPWLEMGEICLDLKQPEKAKPFFERALSVDPQSTAVLLGLLEGAIQEGDLEEAVGWCDRAMKSLGIPRSHTIQSLQEFILILLDLVFTLRSRPERRRMKNILAQLPLDADSLSRCIDDMDDGVLDAERRTFFIDELNRFHGKPVPPETSIPS